MSLAQRPLPLSPPSRNVGAFRFQHRRGIAIPGPFGAANRAASSKQARFIRHWRRFACFPHTPLKRPDQGACGPPILDYTPGGVGLRPLPFGNLTPGGGAANTKEIRHPQMRRQAASVQPVLGAPGRRLSSYVGTSHDNSRICGQLDTSVSS